MLGNAQIVVLIVLVQNVVEALYAEYNTRQLLARGATEAGHDFFPVAAVTRLAWLAAIFLIVSADAKIVWPLMGAYALLQAGRYWVMALLGRFWTLRIVVAPEGTLVSAGPYRYLAHPWYTLVMLETFLLPLVFGAWEISVVMTAVTGVVVWYQIGIEEEALELPRRTAELPPEITD